MGTRIAMLALSALLGAAAMYGTTEAQMPAGRRTTASSSQSGPYTPGVGVERRGLPVGPDRPRPGQRSARRGRHRSPGQAGDGEPRRGAQGGRARLRRRRQDHHLHDRPGRVRQGQRHLRHVLPGRRRAPARSPCRWRRCRAARASRSTSSRRAERKVRAIMEMPKPGEAHARLQKLVGRWRGRRDAVSGALGPGRGPGHGRRREPPRARRPGGGPGVPADPHGVHNFAGHAVFWWDRRRAST